VSLSDSLSPLILSSQITLPPGGAMAVPDPTRLTNPFGAPMWLDEIRIRLTRFDDFDSPATLWANMRIELKLGDNLPITKDFVPLSLLGKVLNSSTIAESDDTGGIGNVGPTIFTWHLPKPLFIPAREYLKATLYCEPAAGFSPANLTKVVDLIYACRPLAKGTPAPKWLQIPWVSYFKPPLINIPAQGGAVDRTDESQPSDLYNPWNEDLHVQRFVGRLMGVPQFELEGVASLASARVNLDTRLVEVGTLVSAQDSFNNILIRDLTPFAHVFNFLDRAWTVNCVMPPKGFYLFTIDRLWNQYVPIQPMDATVGISMVGWREVAYTP
jgi:hypothetical protein